MEPHVIEPADIRQIVLTDRELELWLIDLHQRRVELIQKRKRVGQTVAPAAVPKLHRDRIGVKRAQQIRKVGAFGITALEARRKLRKQRAHLAAFGEWIDAAAEFIHVGLIRPCKGGNRLTALE